MLTFLMVLLGIFFVLLCLFLVLIVLIQPGRSGGGMGGLTGGAGGAISETLGATQGEKTLVKWTAVGMAIFFGLCIGLTILGNTGQSALMLDDGPDQPAIAPPPGEGAGTMAPIEIPVDAPAPAPVEEPAEAPVTE